MDRKSRKKNRRTVAVAIGVLALAIAGFATRDDWAGLREQRATANAAEAERQRAEKQLAELAEKRARLESPMGQEERARSMGYRRPGEVDLGVR